MPTPHQLGKQRINTCTMATGGMVGGQQLTWGGGGSTGGMVGRQQLTWGGGGSCVSFWTCLCPPPLIWDSSVFSTAVLASVTDTAASQTGLKSILEGGVSHLKDLQPQTSSFPIPTHLCCLRFHSSVVLVTKVCLTLL